MEYLKMTKPIIRIHDIETDTIIDREMTDAEYAQHQQEVVESQARLDALAQAQIQRQALLDKLGITEEEAKLLLS